MKKVDLKSMDRNELEEFAYNTSIENDELKLRVRGYEEQEQIDARKKFSRKGEPSDADQMSFFNEAEANEDQGQPEPTLEKVHPPKSTKHKKQKGSKDKMLSSLPKETTEYRLSPEESVCPKCGEPMHTMKKEIRRELTLIPSRVEVRESVIYSYACRNCESSGTGSPILRADKKAPALLFRNCLVSPSLGAHIICRKYDNRDPLEKISSDFHMQGVKLTKQTLSNWICRLSEQYLSPFVDIFHGELKQQYMIHADETEVQVISEPGRTAQQKSRMWVFCSGACQDDKGAHRPVVQYLYSETRKREVAENYLQDYEGFIQSDGYIVYHTLHDGIIDVGCMAHVRRKYYDAVSVLPKSGRRPSAKPCIGLKYTNDLMDLDRQRKELTTIAEMTDFKKKKIAPKLRKFIKWASDELPKEKDGKYRDALLYTVNQKEYLENYLLDGRLEATNNIAERAVRPFVMGRKNWMFCKAPRGASASSVMYSIIETAKANRLKPESYLAWLLEELRGKDMSTFDLTPLLPWSENIPEECKQTL